VGERVTGVDGINVSLDTVGCVQEQKNSSTVNLIENRAHALTAFPL